MIEKIFNFIDEHNYTKEKDYPCLFDQYLRFETLKPLKGFKVLHSTPLFANVIPKLLPLIASECTLVISTPDNIPFSKEALDFVESLNIRCEKQLTDYDEKFDFVLDCTGTYSSLNHIHYGASELTKSGELYYKNSPHPCISADRSKIKLIEDRIGISDGLIRALNQLKLSIKNKKVLLFGYGKVGQGIYNRLISDKAKVTVVDIKNLKNESIDFIPAQDIKEVQDEARQADFIITATGNKNIIGAHYKISHFMSPKTIRINMGAEDEFGQAFKEADILNHKAPLNFILNEPTQLKYLDATFALHNEVLLSFLEAPHSPGIHRPSLGLEKYLLEISEKAGINLDSQLW